MPLLHRLPDTEFVAIDLPYHGSKSVCAVVDEAACTVEHPASKFVTLNTETLRREVLRLRSEFGECPIVGVEHSAGATALWNVEVKRPGTFAGLVLFEPVVEEPGTRDAKTQKYIFNFAMKRQHRWETREAAVEYFTRSKGLATLDRESLACWLEGAIVPEKDGSETVVLACHPTIEAAAYCRERLWPSDQEMARVACPVSFHSSDDTWLFDFKHYASVEERWPRIYKNHPPMKNTTHNLIMEKPMACAAAIHADLKEIACFNASFAEL
ncbi:hypothetical protein PHYSODRAFT_312153 [Phytophthora sojae]|uniref:AB hydrolase-1 domain-containing protein n=1 Tax=Phytophthora sojae (strain P6497) TaxID=1094619 RepID=G4Z1K1_PHYSP|nr:hypothetical protein PHYSODRAFT_312153 [Phytophthora sojae]EGZ25912.1 hypothetical protein PHYSODRAFT_312153 [Phytophthora sojae]|eukprot:XP_009521200.1 hypothetical protein PHYSODRAFT_312153 [Phytophthora sojae]